MKTAERSTRRGDEEEAFVVIGVVVVDVVVVVVFVHVIVVVDVSTLLSYRQVRAHRARHSLNSFAVVTNRSQ